MEKVILKVPGTMKDKGQLADGTRRLQVDLQEINDDQLFEVIRNCGKLGWFIFSPQSQDINEDDLKDLPKIEFDKDEKSPGQILRARMFVYYKEKNKTTEGFYQWYSSQLEKIGQSYLDRINV